MPILHVAHLPDKAGCTIPLLGCVRLYINNILFGAYMDQTKNEHKNMTYYSLLGFHIYLAIE